MRRGHDACSPQSPGAIDHKDNLKQALGAQPSASAAETLRNKPRYPWQFMHIGVPVSEDPVRLKMTAPVVGWDKRVCCPHASLQGRKATGRLRHIFNTKHI